MKTLSWHITWEVLLMSGRVVWALSYLLLILGMLIIGIGLVGIYLKEGVLGIQAALNPIIVWNYIATFFL